MLSKVCHKSSNNANNPSNSRKFFAGRLIHTFHIIKKCIYNSLHRVSEKGRTGSLRPSSRTPTMMQMYGGNGVLLLPNVEGVLDDSVLENVMRSMKEEL